MQQLRNDYSLTFPPLSIARYSFIQLSRLRRRELKWKKMPKLRNGNNGDSNPGSLDCESGILPTELPRSTEMWIMKIWPLFHVSRWRWAIIAHLLTSRFDFDNNIMFQFVTRITTRGETNQPTNLQLYQWDIHHTPFCENACNVNREHWP